MTQSAPPRDLEMELRQAQQVLAELMVWNKGLKQELQRAVQSEQALKARVQELEWRLRQKEGA